MSNSFWNPFLYWLLNAHFRRISRDLLSTIVIIDMSLAGHSTSSSLLQSFQCFFYEKDALGQKSRCCSFSSEFDPVTTVPLPPGPPKHHPPRHDVCEGMSEKYWGEILERTLSSNSLHALQRSYGHTGGLQSHQLSSSLTNTSVLSLNHLSNGSSKEIGPKSPNHSSSYNNCDKRDLENGINRGEDDEVEDEEEEVEDEDEGDEEEEGSSGESGSTTQQQQHMGRVSFLTTGGSESRLCEYSFHDKNCAKTKAFNAQHNAINVRLPDI